VRPGPRDTRGWPVPHRMHVLQALQGCAEYQFCDDFIMDSSAAETAFGLKPTPWEEIIAVTASR
jgi:hypothetical protein